MDGLGLTAALRADERTRDVPIVMLTSRASDEDRRRGLEAGADSYIVKSQFDEAALLGIVGQLVRILQADDDISVVATADGCCDNHGQSDPRVRCSAATAGRLRRCGRHFRRRGRRRRDSLGPESLNVIEWRMRRDPVPVIALVAGALSERDGRRAVAAGAVHTLRLGTSTDGPALRRLVRLMTGVAVVRRAEPPPAEASGCPVVAIGASTGGPAAVATVLSGLGGLSSPVLLVQHIHHEFTADFVSWLASVSPLPVVAATAGERPLPGHVYVAPSAVHLHLAPGRTLALAAEPASLHRPSIDELFRSVAATAGPGSVGVLLTGMGADGAAGLLAMRAAGATTIAQDEETSVVYGMPKVAMTSGAVERSLPLGQIAPAILAHLHTRERR